jgi:hypothetical protein
MASHTPSDQELVMPRALLLPLTMMILIATAMAMLAGAMLLPTSALPELSGPDGTGVVERFYAAVNETIATGNPAPVQRVVNPSFADENPLPGVNPGRDGLEAYLVALHNVDPGLRLEANVISASASQVVTHVQVGREPTAPLPTTVGDRRAVWSPVEVFRVADGVVVKRWGQTDGLAFTRQLAEQQLELSLPTPRVVGLARITLAPGTRWDAPRVSGPRLLYLQGGALEVQAVPGSVQDATFRFLTSNASATERVTLGEGASWLAPAGSQVSTTNVGSATAQVLAVTFTEPQLPSEKFAKPRALPSGVTVQVLAGDLATDLGSGPVAVTLEQIACAPNAGLNLSSTDGPILVAVEAGQLDATAWGAAWLRRHRGGMSVASRADSLTTDNGMLLQPGGVVALRNGEQQLVSALVVTVRATGADRGP